MKNQKLKILAEAAIMVALSFVLSLVKLWEMPFGGAITLLSMLPVCIVSLRHGLKWGLGAAFVYSVTQALLSGATGWGLSITALILCYLLDYIIAFAVLGLAGIFRNGGAKGQVLGICFVCLLRFASHYLSGVILWREAGLAYGIANPYLYSLLYNGFYMIPETVFTCIAAIYVLKAFKKFKI